MARDSRQRGNAGESHEGRERVAGQASQQTVADHELITGIVMGSSSIRGASFKLQWYQREQKGNGTAHERPHLVPLLR